ncbi:histidine--tRNA ligase [Enterobacteriaceae endosymbiont of Plateumaris consimilis]|uniref:histidine--tRNA ligase n=1 Tax=Enterobacteriaceae endosymbiont of Plateumaris consimilis TaxID=2675794 RepID=UPI001449CEC5|nr:histidine--tRNA ligase [Enterobacteriaceae endosymbiont of Plateumaris consimilis]QJC28463.1 histidine--tRNA ligase [Enterobacteriaceae endosymbiont of Plateumaris consimilis]
MIENITAVHGMHDYFFPDTLLWEHVENIIKRILINYGYKEIKIPILEKSILFKQVIGEMTDIVEKEMYNLNDRNGESLTLRPEGTAGCIRAVVEHNTFSFLNQRLWYNGPMFRYERPQRGRYRQFNQIGIEVLGLESPYIDSEIIIMTNNIWRELNIINNVFLEINSIGSIKDREKYIKKLITYLEKNFHLLDEDCKRRIYTNPLRILDSKNPDIQELLNKAPKLQNFLSKNCIVKLNKLCDILNMVKINFSINYRLVRGLDYYNDIVFEWITNQLGSHKTICGGGRYDKLVKKLSKKNNINGIGCAIGIERLILLIKKINSIKLQTNYLIDIYLIPMDIDVTLHKAICLREIIRKKFPLLKTVISYYFSNLKKQIIKAIKQKVHFLLIIGKKEIDNNQLTIKDLFLKKQITFLEKELIFKLLEILNY